MAILKHNKTTALKLKVFSKLDAKGNEVYKYKTINGMNAAMSDESALKVANAIGTLLESAVYDVNRVDGASIVQDMD